MITALFAALAVAAPSQLHIQGTKVVDAGGHEVKFHGINVCSLEWTAVGDHVEQSIPVALDQWGANLIRLPMSEDRWFGKAPDSKDDGADYQKRIDSAVAQVAQRGKYILLDLHWSNAGEIGKNIGQRVLPDAESLDFWKACGKRYANNPAVLFDLYNEPIEASWETWHDGGPITEDIGGRKVTYQAVGLQTLLDAIRGEGAKNIIVAGGLGYASRVDGLLTHPLIDKNGNGVLYASHFYPGWESVESWEARIEPATHKIPLLIGEFGAGPQTLPLDDPQRRAAQVLGVLRKHDWNWCAWCMHPAAAPCLIQSWDYKPTPYYGSLVQMALKGEAVPIPARKQTAEDHAVYTDVLESQFQSWSNAAVDLNASPAHTGSKSIKVDAKAGQQLQLGTVPFDGLPYRAIVLWLNGGPIGGQKLVMRANVMDDAQKIVTLPLLTANQWTRVDISFNDLGIADKDHVKSFTLRSADYSSLPTYYVDDIEIFGRR